MAHFILVHGAFHGGWCWERLVPALGARGHTAVAPDLPGMGDDPLPTGEATLDIWAAFIAGLVDAAPSPPILVGHSRGGIVISQAAERAADRIAGLVYLTAVLMPHGVSVNDHVEQHVAASGGGARMGMEAAADGLTLRVPRDDVAPFLYHRTDTAGQARAAAAVGAEPVAPFATPLVLSDARWGSLPRAYIECTDDRCLPLALQRSMQAALPCDPVIAIDSDHSPFFSATDELAGALTSIAKGWDA